MRYWNSYSEAWFNRPRGGGGSSGKQHAGLESHAELRARQPGRSMIRYTETLCGISAHASDLHFDAQGSPLTTCQRCARAARKEAA